MLKHDESPTLNLHSILTDPLKAFYSLESLLGLLGSFFLMCAECVGKGSSFTPTSGNPLCSPYTLINPKPQCRPTMATPQDHDLTQTLLGLAEIRRCLQLSLA